MQDVGILIEVARALMFFCFTNHSGGLFAAVCCSVLQCVAVCRSVLLCVAVCCSVLL